LRDYFQDDITDLRQIIRFDWNQANKAILTVEEMIMVQLTNDNNDLVNPQMAQIAFAEFKKFMFLNLKYLDKEKKLGSGISSIRSGASEDGKLHKGSR